MAQKKIFYVERASSTSSMKVHSKDDCECIKNTFFSTADDFFCFEHYYNEAVKLISYSYKQGKSYLYNLLDDGSKTFYPCHKCMTQEFFSQFKAIVEQYYKSLGLRKKQ